MNQPEITAEVLQSEETRYLLKSPGFVATLSALVMGLGQLFNGQVKKASIFFASEVAVFLYLWDFFGPRVVTDTFLGVVGSTVYQALLVLLGAGGVFIWIHNIRDAYQTAQFLDFIFDRSTPVLDADEEAFLRESMTVTHMGVRVHRGVSRKAMFVGTALVLYSIALVLLGSRMAADTVEMRLRRAIRAAPADATLHLKLGELLLAHGEKEPARCELEKAVSLAKTHKDSRTIYLAHTSLARLYTELGRDEQANSMLQSALSLYSPAAQPASDAIESAQGQPRESAEEGQPADASVQASPETTGASPAPAPSARAAAGESGATSRPTRAVERLVEDGGETTGAGGAPVLVMSARFAKREQAAADEDEAAEPASGAARRASATPTVSPVIAGDARDLMSRALSNFKVKNHDEARQLLEAYARKASKDRQYLALSGRLHAAQANWEAAASDLSRAVEAGRTAEPGAADPDLELVLSEVLVRCGKTEQAVPHLAAYLKARPGETRAVLMLADVHRKAGRGADAARAVNEALALRPDDPELLSATFRVALDTPSEEAAYQAALKILKAPRREPERVRAMITQALDAGRTALAHRVANVILSRDADDPLGHTLKGAVYVRENKNRSAMACFQKAAELGSQEPELFHEVGLLYRKLGKGDRAIESLKRAVELAPASATYSRELGVTLFGQGHYDLARASFQRVLKSAPSDVGALIGLGECHLRLGRTAEAKRDFETALEYDPDNEAARKWLAVAGAGHRPEQALAAGPRTADAVVGAATVEPSEAQAPSPAVRASGERSAEADRAGEDESASAEPTGAPPRAEPAAGSGRPQRADRTADRAAEDERLQKADLALRAGDLKSAEEFVRQVLRERPDHGPALYRLAMVQKSGRSTDRAIDSLEAANRAMPGDVAILLELGQLYTETNQAGPAIRRLEELVRVDPSNLAGRYSLGVNYERARQYGRAEREYRAISGLYPQFHEAHDYLGNLYFSQRRYKLAASEYEILSRAKPREAKPRFKMAVALFYQNERDRSRETFRSLASELPADDPLLGKVQGYLAKL